MKIIVNHICNGLFYKSTVRYSIPAIRMQVKSVVKIVVNIQKEIQNVSEARPKIMTMREYRLQGRPQH